MRRYRVDDGPCGSDSRRDRGLGSRVNELTHRQDALGKTDKGVGPLLRVQPGVGGASREVQPVAAHSLASDFERAILTGLEHQDGTSSGSRLLDQLDGSLRA